jgi:hypothetical protein
MMATVMSRQTFVAVVQNRTNSGTRMNTKSLSKCFFKLDDIVTRQIAGETSVVPIRAKTEDVDSIFTLNELGTMIWNLLDGRTSVTRIVEAVSTAYDVSPDEATKDTIDFLNSLNSEGLIQEGPE